MVSYHVRRGEDWSKKPGVDNNCDSNPDIPVISNPLYWESDANHGTTEVRACLNILASRIIDNPGLDNCERDDCDLGSKLTARETYLTGPLICYYYPACNDLVPGIAEARAPTRS
uniref:Uncharacterized protein n=1 Tax=Timema bartmani TaxID=61472 RepID=A0A7R9I4B7_9NEOP|nr:unnamed protein product [Timema bartmani]